MLINGYVSNLTFFVQLPEALEMAYSLSGNSKSRTIRMMFLQNLAMVFGFVVMFILALYGGLIEV